jgi:hypothetical protein
VDAESREIRECENPPKNTAINHVVNQMRTIPGGISRLMEHWIEQYHQVGHRFDMAYCRVGSLKGQAEIRARAEKRGSNPRVQMKKKLLDNTFTKKKRKRSAIANDEKALQVIRNCHMVDRWGIQDHPVMPLWLDHSSGINS